VLGLPSYGYISKSTATGLRQRRGIAHLLPERPIYRASESHGAYDEGAVEVINDVGGGDDGGQIQFNELISQGALIRNEPSDPTNNIITYTGSGGFTRYWDECSSTPFLHSESNRQIITYDDPVSLGMKAAFAVRVGMLGVNMFDVHGDSVQWDLIDSVRQNLGL
jgi:chitinase